MNVETSLKKTYRSCQAAKAAADNRDLDVFIGHFVSSQIADIL
jgi:hypothetical protein